MGTQVSTGETLQSSFNGNSKCGSTHNHMDAIIDKPTNLQNFTMQGVHNGSTWGGSRDDLECFSFTREDIENAMNGTYKGLHHILPLTCDHYKNLQPCLCTNDTDHDTRLHSQTHVSPPNVLCKSIQLATIDASHTSPSLYTMTRANSEHFYCNTLDQKKLAPTLEDASILEESYSLFKTKVDGSRATSLDASRYFNALKGPELEILKDSECSVLPMDKKWPFLLRFPIGCFGINLGLGSQVILWKMLTSHGYVWFMQVPNLINLLLWCVATIAYIIVSIIYGLKIIFYFEAVRREFNHPIRINYFFAPWIACMFLTLGVPPTIAISIHPNLWTLLMAPIFALELKVYGEWVSGGERRLCKVANPSTHLSLLGNFVGALLAATVGYKELALFFWSVGFIHYLVLLVTLYQRLPSATVLPKELHPIFFLFVALPSSASVAWAKIMGKFDLPAKVTYFVAMFLFFSLVAKARLFCGFRFNIAWWAYTFPLTVSAIATFQYSLEVTHPLTQSLAALLTITSSIIVLILTITTIIHTFVWRSMFPNDMAIAITSKGIKAKRKIKELHEDLLPL